MKLIQNPFTEPYFNLSAEEYLLCGHDSVFMLWQNAPSVIIGKNQNAFGEVNLSFVSHRGIPVVRRLTGGGAVYHDLGNVNYTFIGDAFGGGIDFGRYCAPIISALGKMGVNCSLDGRNDIVSGERKISGGAQCVYITPDGRRRHMHHGTLLFSADISEMSDALNVNTAKLSSKGIKSVRSRVANISALPGYRGPDSVSGFTDELFSAVRGEKYQLSDKDHAEIQRLADEKYSRYEWNFGRSPVAGTVKQARFDAGGVFVAFNLTGGVMTDVSITGDFFAVRDIGGLERALTGVKYTINDASAAVNTCCVNDYIAGLDNDAFIKLLFE